MKYITDLKVNLDRHVFRAGSAIPGISFVPSLTISRAIERKYCSLEVDTDSIELHGDEYLDDIINLLRHELAKKIAEDIDMSKLKVEDTIDPFRRKKTYTLGVNYILPDEKIEYEARDKFAAELIEKGFRKAEKYYSRCILAEKKIVSIEAENERVVKYLTRKRTFLERLEILLVGKPS